MTSETQGKESTNGYVTCLGIGCGGLILLGVLVFAGFYLNLYCHSINETDAVKQCTFAQIAKTFNPDFNLAEANASGLGIDCTRTLADAVAAQKHFSDFKISTPDVWAREVRDGKDLKVGGITASMTVDSNARVKIVFWTATYTALGMQFTSILGIRDISISTDEWIQHTGLVDNDNIQGKFFLLSVYAPATVETPRSIVDFIKTKNEESQKRKLNR